MWVSSRKLLKAQGWNYDNQHAASSVQTVALNVLFERLQKVHFAFKLQTLVVVVLDDFRVLLFQGHHRPPMKGSAFNTDPGMKSDGQLCLS